MQFHLMETGSRLYIACCFESFGETFDVPHPCRARSVKGLVCVAGLPLLVPSPSPISSVRIGSPLPRLSLSATPEVLSTQCPPTPQQTPSTPSQCSTCHGVCEGAPVLCALFKSVLAVVLLDLESRPLQPLSHRKLRTPESWTSLPPLTEGQTCVVLGPLQVGKSTFCQWYLNRLLTRQQSFQPVLLLDLDCGQPLVGVPGTVSLHLLLRPLLLQNASSMPPKGVCGHTNIEHTQTHTRTHTHRAQTHAESIYSPFSWVAEGGAAVCGDCAQLPICLASNFVGTITPENNERRFLEAVQDLMQVKRRWEQLSGRTPPMVVNSFGWVSGLGWQLLDAASAIVEANKIMYIEPRNAPRRTEGGDTPVPTTTSKTYLSSWAGSDLLHPMQEILYSLGLDITLPFLRFDANRSPNTPSCYVLQSATSDVIATINTASNDTATSRRMKRFALQLFGDDFWLDDRLTAAAASSASWYDYMHEEKMRLPLDRFSVATPVELDLTKPWLADAAFAGAVVALCDKSRRFLSLAATVAVDGSTPRPQIEIFVPRRLRPQLLVPKARGSISITHVGVPYKLTLERLRLFVRESSKSGLGLNLGSVPGLLPGLDPNKTMGVILREDEQCSDYIRAFIEEKRTLERTRGVGRRFSDLIEESEADENESEGAHAAHQGAENDEMGGGGLEGTEARCRKGVRNDRRVLAPSTVADLSGARLVSRLRSSRLATLRRINLRLRGSFNR